MPFENLGDYLNEITKRTRNRFFDTGRLVQLSYTSFLNTKTQIEKFEVDPITVQFPIGQRPDGEPILTKSEHTKSFLMSQYDLLAFSELALTGIYSLVTGIEVMLAEAIKAIILKYPQKLPGNKKIDVSKVLNCQTLESVHIIAAQTFIVDLTYKSPKDFAEAVKNIFDLDLQTLVPFQKYIEIKATRDIFIHNQGIANEIYEAKANILSRARAGQPLPMNNQYFLSSYETCLQLTEALMNYFHEKWHCQEYENLKKKFQSKNQT